MKYIAAFILILGFTFTSQAQAKRLPINKTKFAQKARINNGVQTCRLTQKESKILGQQQRNISKTIAKSKSDGVVTRKERALINRKQVKADKTIYRLKHN